LTCLQPTIRLFHLFLVQKKRNQNSYATEAVFSGIKGNHAEIFLFGEVAPSTEIPEVDESLEKFKEVVHDELSEGLLPKRDIQASWYIYSS